jgi:hypothetical protein
VKTHFCKIGEKRIFYEENSNLKTFNIPYSQKEVHPGGTQSW